MVLRESKSILILGVSIFLLVSQVLIVGVPIWTERIETNESLLDLPAIFSPAYTTSGIEILLGGDYIDHNIAAWENIDQTWEEDASFEIYDPGWGLINDIVIADIDGDNMMETIVANSGGMIHIYEHEGADMILTHNLTHPSWQGSQVNNIAVGDLDNDGSPYLEILAGTHDDDIISVVFKKIGASYYPVFNISSSDSSGGWGLTSTIGDMDNNGDLEFIVTEQSAGTGGVSLLRLFDWQTDTWVNIRNHSFVKGEFLNNIEQVQIADVDNDDENEVLVNHDQEYVHVLEYTGGVFVKSWSCALLDVEINCAIAGDITNDGLIDIVVPDPSKDLIYIYETVTGSIVNTFNISFVHDNHWGSGGYTCMDIGELYDDGQNEWVFVHWNETAFPHVWITIFRNDTVLQEGPTGYLYASTVEIGNYDNDEAGTVATTTTSSTTVPTTPTTNTTAASPIPLEILVIVVVIPIAFVVIAIVVKRQRG